MNDSRYVSVLLVIVGGLGLWLESQCKLLPIVKAIFSKP
jgi:hypothetical protein